jgi:uncharacterized protein YkwD
MRCLVVRPLLFAAAAASAAVAAQAQPAGAYGPYPRPPIYIPEPGHPADDAPFPSSARPPAPADGPPPAGAAAPAYALLAPQNAVRATVGDPPLSWSNRLAAVAQGWADHLIATHQFAHRTGDPYGENLYAITGGIAAPDQVVAAWADEATGYDLRTNQCSGVCGHYTQIVWRSTRRVGCAVASDAMRQVWVCEYDPPGNVVGYRPF